MFVSIAPGEIVTKQRMRVQGALIAAILLPALFVCNVARAQVTGMVSPTPSMGATSPLGITTGSSVPPTGIPFGSTEVASPGVSPAPIVTGTISMPSGSATCSTLGTSLSGMYGSSATYDGGGIAAGTAAPATAASPEMSTSSAMTTSSGMSATSGMSTTSGMLQTSGMSGMCGSGSSGIASSSTPTSTSPTAPGGGARTGIPLGSTEIGNLGVSSAAAVPTMGVLPTVGTVGPVPTMPTVTSPPTLLSPTTSTASGSTLPGHNLSGSTLAPTGAGS